jgi:hypothetical protein
MPSLNPDYVIGAVAVIALLAVVAALGGLWVRKSRARARQEQGFAGPAPDGTSGPEAWQPGDDELSDEDGRLTAVVEPERVGYTGPADDAYPATETRSAVAVTSARPPVTSAEPQAGPMPDTDPAMVLVRSLLQNSGELDPTEFRRLELYRPQRIIEAADTLMPKMTGRSNESKRSRLLRIRQYAVSLLGEFESEGTEIVAVPGGAAPVEPGVIAPPSHADMTHVPPPEDWGSEADGSELALDPELSLLHDGLSPVPETEESPAPETEESLASETEESLAPPRERSVNDLSSMSPREIGNALALSDEIDYKMAAIDALEHLGTPEALAQLQHCLEDPDPDVQLYALSAAERLLGPS